MQQQLAVLAVGKRASVEMARQIRQFFPENTVKVSAFCLDDLRRSAHAPIKAHLAVISCPSAVPLLEPFIDNSTPCMVARRTLSLNAIDRLMDLPAGTRTLLVTKNPLAIAEFMQTIQEMGISHISVFSLHTHDYNLCSTITTVLLADEPEQIPPWARQTIDLGVREVELSSLIEIANRLNQHMTISTPISTHYLQEIVARSERQVQTLKAIDLLNRQLNAVLNNVQDCLIVVDADYTVRFVNDITLKLIGLEPAQAIGKPLYSILPELSDAALGSGTPITGEKVVTIKNRTFHISLQTIKDKTEQFISCIISLRNVTDVMRAEKEVRQALKTRGHFARYHFADIVGCSPVIADTIRTAKKLAASDLNVLICGENGTGKELFAHSIHNASPRANGPFIAVNCAALPSSLLESELFGYEDGAFTGAKKGGKPGLIEQADGGTIFLDEIGDISLEAQSSLLRVIQEKAVMRVSSTRVIAVNARIIAATNKNLLDKIARGEFRQDLFYRLFVAPLQLPPLRSRPEDIELLLRYFMRENGVDERFLDSKLLERLKKYSWPGNIRELQSLIQYASIVGEDPPSFTKAIISRIDGFRDFPPTLPLNLAPADLPLYINILALLAEAKARNIRLGRRSLAQQLAYRHLVISEQVLRTKLAKLQEAELLTCGIGRQGTCITAKGEAFLRTYANASSHLHLHGSTELVSAVGNIN